MTDETTGPRAALLNNAVRQTWRRWWELFNELLTHALTIVFVVVVIEFIDWFIETTHHGGIVFFERTKYEFPIKYALEAADTAMIGCISVVAIYTVVRGARR